MPHQTFLAHTARSSHTILSAHSATFMVQMYSRLAKEAVLTLSSAKLRAPNPARPSVHAVLGASCVWQVLHGVSYSILFMLPQVAHSP